MSDSISRRDVLKHGAAAASFAAFGGWDGSLPALRRDEEVIPWTDIPANFVTRGNLDTRTVDRTQFITATENFYLVQHYGTPEIDSANYALRLTGMFEKPLTLTLDELKARPRFEQIV